MNGRRGRSRSCVWHVVPAVIAVAMAGGVARAQGSENLSLARTYGSGVHAFFSGDFDRSYDDLTAAIEAGSEDPRSLYFRGLSALRLGRLDEAEADFSAGADLEARAIGDWPVSRSLERVQGHDRLRLERHRVRARVAAMQRDQAGMRARYSGIQDAQPEVLRSRRPATAPPPAGGKTNPFADQSEPGPPPVERPQPPEPETMPAPVEPESVGPENPAVEEPAAPEQLQPEAETPPADAGEGTPEAPVAEEPAMAAEEDGPAPVPAEDAPAIPETGDAGAGESPAPAEEPAAPDEPAPPAVEDPFGDNTPQPEAPAEPAPEAGDAPAADGQ